MIREWIELNANSIGEDEVIWVKAQEGKFLITARRGDDSAWHQIPEELYRDLVEAEKKRRGL